MTTADAQREADILATVDDAETKGMLRKLFAIRAEAKAFREARAALDAANAEMREMRRQRDTNVAAGEKARRQLARLDALEVENKALHRELASLKERFRDEKARVAALSRQVDIANAERKRLGLTV